MKEILYRAKAINRDPNMNYRTNYQNGDWVYGLVSRLDEYSAEMTDKSGVSGIDIDRKTICEFAGLYDKNGNKIFEGDVLEFNDEYGIWRASVVFTRGLFGIDVYNKKQIKNPENWDREYPITQSRGWGCAWGYEEFGTAFSHRKPLAQITLYKGKEEDYKNSDYYKLHEKCGWGNYFTMSAVIIGNIYDNPELLEK